MGKLVPAVDVNIITSGKNDISVNWENNPVAEIVKKQVKHLQHLPLFFSKGDITRNIKDKNKVRSELLTLGEKLGVNINPEILSKQCYLNHLHTHYEQRAPIEGFKQGWSDYHDCIHILENDNEHDKNVIKFFTYEQFGPLVKPYKEEYNQYKTLDIKQGDVTVSWSELGKKPIQYWLNKEPNKQDRINELVVPWHNLMPVLNVYMDNYKIIIPDKTVFLKWFQHYKDNWCKHWNLKNWTFEDQYGDIVIGNVPDIIHLKDNIRAGYIPNKVRL